MTSLKVIFNPIVKRAISWATEDPRQELAQVLSFRATGTPTFLENNVVSSPAKKQRTLVFLDLKSHCMGLVLKQHNIAFFVFQIT